MQQLDALARKTFEDCLQEPGDRSFQSQLLLLSLFEEGARVGVGSAGAGKGVGEEEAQQVRNYFGGKLLLVEVVAELPQFHGAGGQLFAPHRTVEKAIICVVAKLFENSPEADEGVSVWGRGT